MSEATLRAVERAVIKKIAKESKLLANISCTAQMRWRRRLLLTGASVAALTAFSAGSASAQTWIGTTNDWTVGSNWSGGTVPGAGTMPLIDASNPAVLGVGSSATATVNSVRIGGTTGSLTIQNGSTLNTTSSTTESDIGVTAAGNATVTVTGAGSLWNASSIGVATSGTGTLDIENGATVVTTIRTRLGPTTGTGTLNITGGTLETAALAVGVHSQANFDNGVLRALGNNATWITGTGTLNIAAGGLTVDSSGFNVGVAPAFQGVGGLTKIGAGTLTLSGANSYGGDTVVQAGTLQAGATNAFSSASAYTVNSAGTLDLNGFNQTLASLNNSGIVRTGGVPGTTLTVSGNYVGNGGTLWLNSVLGGDASATDRMAVQGSTSGTTLVKVTNVGGLGAQTVNGIQIINVAGASNGTFSLLGNYTIQGQQAVVAGAYAYTLQKNGITTPADGDWYLRSSLIAPPPSAPAGPLYQPGVPLYENYAQVLLGLNALPTLQERVGDRYWGGNGAGVQSANNAQSPIWVRVEGQHSDLQPQNTTGSTYSADQVKTQVGIDGLAMENDAGKLIVGMSAQYGTVAANISSFYGNGQIRADGYSIGASLTWYGDNGVYVDGQAQATKYFADLSSAFVGTLTGQNDGFGYAFSVESGKRIGLGNGWSITPQAQLTYSSVDFSSFADRFAAMVSLDNADSLLGRAGVQVNYQQTWRDADGQLTSSDIYGIANLHYEFLNGTNVNVAGLDFADANDRLWGSVGIGGSYSWHGGKYSLYGELSYNTSLSNIGVNDSYKGVGGFRIVW